MSSTWKNNISFTVFGESHGPAIGVCMDNVPPGESIDVDKIYKFMARRAPKKDGTTTMRKESDIPQIISGYHNGKTTGTPLVAMIANNDQHSQDYNNISKLARPGHADYTGALRYRGFNDIRGGGHFSGRLTAPLCFAGAVAQQILEKRGIYIGAHIAEIHGITDKSFDPINTSRQDIIDLKEKDFPVIIDVQGNEMKKEILHAREEQDSVGGIIECIAINVPAGIGSPIFDGLENSIAQLIFGIPAVKGLEFGAGFDVAKMTGSENNDEFYVNERGIVVTKTNSHGGILGGISSGMPITLRVAVKPTPSISRPQETIDYSAMKNETLVVKGRHDPCIVPRAVPCVEAAVSLAVLSHMLEYPNF
ncbi:MULTISPECIES: chorismate synthase [Ruminococcus]|jgi:chorismate synthase|uniref:Chorismate synthase n=1 Tax=Ruminococcus albus 8 TaxID=246199 RepID=E9SF95_RUMAL|nr:MULTISPECIES: chorismate synthase [Ruminococcus]MBE6873294.1 chorismate synthase [Ruminococcus albus]EGC02072.1 chorismate synthase [Ruminococcus albus 8]MBQ9540973.1 chorismate synthase [Ruminococcus sp.]MBR0529624.1 chorismate synthase [Ruminococcus sp.]MCC3350886.1 chorismate synthase [Ruminococcus albus 8]